MGTVNQHKAKAEHNEAFVSTFDLSTTPFLDWAVTGIFYAALHYVRAFAASKRITNISSYGEMDKLFDRIAGLKQLYRHYRFLKDESRAARYEVRAFTRPEVEEMQRLDLAAIKHYVATNLV